MTKAAHFHKLCRTLVAYYQAYENGIGPGQDWGNAAVKPRFVVGLGDVVAWTVANLARGDEKLLTEIGIRADKLVERISFGRFKANSDGSCRCADRRAWLNRHFPLWPIRWPWRKLDA